MQRSAQGVGLCRSKTVVERLDVRFKGDLLFRRFCDDAEGPMDDVLLRLAAGKLRPGRIAMLRLWIWALTKDRRFHAVALSAGSGAMLLGTLGGSCGLALGAIAGAAAGAVPAPLTFGISIPVGAVAGSAAGACVGVVACSSIGLVGAGVAGGVAYEYRVEVLKGIARVRAMTPSGFVTETVDFSRARAGDAMAATAGVLAEVLRRALAGSRSLVERGQHSAGGAAGAAAAKALGLGAEVRAIVSDRQVQVTATAATGGAIVLGTGGGAVGMVAGSALGAAWGLIPAMLTFGLSVPLCATVCGGAGLCTGTAIGGAAGLVSGAAAGFALSPEDKDGPLDRMLRGRGGSWRRRRAVACVGGTGGTA